MTSEATTDKIAALDALLDAERAALLAGDLEKLAEMLEDKEGLIEAINTAEHRNLDALQQLDGKVKRNQLLLDGAPEGLRSVARRMAALRRVRSGKHGNANRPPPPGGARAGAPRRPAISHHKDRACGSGR